MNFSGTFIDNGAPSIAQKVSYNMLADGTTDAVNLTDLVGSFNGGICAQSFMQGGLLCVAQALNFISGFLLAPGQKLSSRR